VSTTVANEVVTRALVRDVPLAGGAGTMALITLDNGRDHTRPNTFGPGGLTSLDETLDAVGARAAAGEITAVGITGKPFGFVAGADLGVLGAAATRDEALAVARRGHSVFRKLGDLPVPSFAFVNGLALGGGLEVALQCTYRTISSGVPALGLPECFLGLVPGWGGAYLLPNLIGVQGAVEVIIGNALSNNRMLNGTQAYQLGIADLIAEPADFLELSLGWAAKVVTGELKVERREVNHDQAPWDAVVDGAKALVDGKLHGAAPAPYRALELIRDARTADQDSAFAAEDEALADLVMGQELRASLYAFDLVNKRAKKPVGVPRATPAPVTKVGVVGAGLMASQLALLFARRLLVPVVLTDLDQERVDRGVGHVRAEIDKLVAKGRLNGDAANRLRALVTGTTDLGQFADAGLVIEAVFEDLGVKQQVFAQVEAVVSETCVLMTNTSSLSVTAMGEGLKHPQRLVGFHFFNPVAVLPLVEVVRTEHTDDVTLATAFDVGKKLRKSCVLTKDATAFVVNRLLCRYIGEVVAAFDEGTPAEVADRAVAPLGLPMTPFELIELIGPAVGVHVMESLHASFPDRFGVSENLRAIAAAGKRGLWSPGPDGKPVIDAETAALLHVGDSPSTAEQVRERVASALAGEIRLMLDEGVVAEAQDIDLCMLLGSGWPFVLGGITPYLDRSGTAEQVTGRRFLPAGVATLP
jgi:3-hydroxyacyl-CoA dehydrogenase/enoyl-CoA hydratase/carnithine racemase